jgi:Na+/melibiose symporter-like transporter
MLPDVISHDARARGGDRAGTFGGMWTAGETTGMALGATALTVVLAVTGYVARTADPSVVVAGATQPGSAVAGIVVAFSVIPAAIVVLSLVPLARYRLRREDVDGLV